MTSNSHTGGTSKFLPLTLLKLGSGVQVELVGLENRVTGIFVGMELGKYLIVRLPLKSGIQNKLNIKNRITIRFVVGGAIYGFHSRIINCIMSPMLLVLLKFPEDIENVTLRKHQRVICFFPVTLSHQGTSYKGHIIDISQGGCRMLFECDEGSCPQALDVDSIKDIDFNILGTAGTHSVRCQIKNLHRDGETLTVGARFDSMDFAVRTAIENYVNEAVRHLEMS